jgi:hypothetical protein
VTQYFIYSGSSEAIHCPSPAIVIAGIVRKVMAGPGVWPARRLPGLAINVELRDEFAPPLTKTIEPAYQLFAAYPVEDIIGENFRNHAWIAISENSNTAPRSGSIVISVRNSNSTGRR